MAMPTDTPVDDTDPTVPTEIARPMLEAMADINRIIGMVLEPDDLEELQEAPGEIVRAANELLRQAQRLEVVLTPIG
jgi:hypothetical protein